jgi:hypothetical protein
MKTFRKLTLVLGAWATFALVSACDPLLNTNPVTQIDASTDLKDALSVRVALTGAYDGLSNRYIWGGESWCYADLMGEENDIRFRGTFQYMGDIWQRTMNSQSNAAQEVWLTGYNAINRVNRILQVIDTALPAERNTIRGGALFIRGAVYFEMIKLYGKAWGDGDNASNPGVPLVLTPAQIFQTGNLSEGEKPRRNSVAEVYAQIISDLTAAEQNLPATSDPTRANKASAAALLSRVYLMQGNYAAARDAANRVIQTNRYTLASSFADCFNETSAGFVGETIFRIPVSEQDGVNQLNVFYSAVPGGRRDMEILAAHLTKYEMGDFRRTYFFSSGGRRLTSKWRDQFGDIPIFRIAEMYLTRAECNARLGTEVGATPASDVNRVRARVGLPALADDAVTVEAILKERRNELAFEGHWLHDRKRTRTNIVSTRTHPWNANTLVFPVPNREIIANTNLTQNPGYTD